MSALARQRPQGGPRTRESAVGLSDTLDDADRAERAALAARIAILEAELAVQRQELTALRALVCPPPPAAAGRDRLRQACVDMGIPISADNHILERDLGRLLCRSTSTIRNWRRGERPLPFRKLGSRVEYALSEVAAFLESRGES